MMGDNCMILYGKHGMHRKVTTLMIARMLAFCGAMGRQESGKAYGAIVRQLVYRVDYPIHCCFLTSLCVV